jgi:hypothetical protein
LVYENWNVTNAAGLPAGKYATEAVFLDNMKRQWSEMKGQGNISQTLIFRPVPLEEITVK